MTVRLRLQGQPESYTKTATNEDLRSVHFPKTSVSALSQIHQQLQFKSLMQQQNPNYSVWTSQELRKSTSEMEH